MTRSANLTFKTADDKTKSIRISNYQGEVPEDDAKAFMEALCASKQFVKDGVQQYARPTKITAVDTETTVVYEYDTPEA